jgi:NTE family protein
LWVTVRSLLNRGGSHAEHRLRDFYVGHGLSPEVRFDQLRGPRLILVATDLKGGCTALFGADPQDSVLDALLASTALPPWVRPLPHNEQLLMDGGAISNLPIEPALYHGATEIVALDIIDPRPVLPTAGGMGVFLYQLVHTVQQRQLFLEKQLAAARSVPVHHILLRSELPIAVWQLDRAASLFQPGYDQMQRYLAEHPELYSQSPTPSRLWWQRLWPKRSLPPGHQGTKDF